MCSASISWVVFDPGAAHISNTCARANRFKKVPVIEDKLSVMRIRDFFPTRIQQQQKKEMKKKLLSILCCGHKSHNIENWFYF
jgi:hypothetical protein